MTADNGVLHDTWQNVTPSPTFFWSEPADARCDAATDPSCDPADPTYESRESSGIVQYAHALGPDLNAAPDTLVARSVHEHVPTASTSEGVTHFRLSTSDRAGNTSDITTLTIKYERTPPQLRWW